MIWYGVICYVVIWYDMIMISSPSFSLPLSLSYSCSGMTDPRARRLGRLLLSNVMELNTDSIPQFSIAPSSSFDQYHRTLRATVPPFKQTGKGSCNEVNTIILIFIWIDETHLFLTYFTSYFILFFYVVFWTDSQKFIYDFFKIIIILLTIIIIIITLIIITIINDIIITVIIIIITIIINIIINTIIDTSL